MELHMSFRSVNVLSIISVAAPLERLPQEAEPFRHIAQTTKRLMDCPGFA
jgi:hypothetical protein